MKSLTCCVLQGAPWCCLASAASSCGLEPASRWWFSCSVSTTASVSLPGTLWMWSLQSCTRQTGGQCRVHMFAYFPPRNKRLWFVNGVFFLLLSFPGARALASATPCASWQPCWATWSLAHWLASPKLFPSCWRRLCWSVGVWWDSDCQTRGPTSSCKPLRESRFFTRCLKRTNYLSNIIDYCLANYVPVVKHVSQIPGK